MRTKTYIIFLLTILCSTVSFGQNEITEAEYYIDQDPGFGNATPIDLAAGENISDLIDANFSDLNPGVYFAYVRVKDQNDMWSIPLKVPFQIQRADLPPVSNAEWFFGDDPGFGNANQIDVQPGETLEGMELANSEGLEAGRHFAYLRFQNADGTWGFPLKKAFVINDKLPLDVVSAEYFIDEDPGFGLGTAIAVDPDHFVSESFLAEVSTDLEFGEHFLYTRLQNEDDVWSINLVRSFSVGTVSTEDEELMQSVKVFPNPSIGPVTILSDNLAVQSVQIFNAQGRLVDQYQNPFKRLEIGGLARGTYLFRITTEKGALTKAVVVQ